jgi:hypothetical protein
MDQATNGAVVAGTGTSPQAAAQAFVATLVTKAGTSLGHQRLEDRTGGKFDERDSEYRQTQNP